MDDVQEEENEEENYNKNDAVKKFQTDVSSSSFLMPENIPSKINAKKKSKEGKETEKFVFAPGEGMVPINILREKHPFVQQFPSLFPTGKGGLHDEDREEKITPQQFAMQRILNIDPTFAECKAFIFNLVYYIEKYQLESKMNISYMKGKFTNDSEGKKFLSSDDAYAAFEGIRGSVKYWQKLKYDMIAKLEQLGPFTYFYTLSLADKRWDEMFATIVSKKCPDLIVMHVIEEDGVKANILDNEDYDCPSDEEIGLDEDEKEYVDPEEEIEVLDNIEEDTDNCQYYVHKKVPSSTANKRKHCKIHLYPDGFVCERTNLNNYFEKKQKTELLAASVLDITRMFDDRLKSFRKNILRAPQCAMCIQYFQDKTEFQNRGFCHIHGKDYLSIS